MNANKLAGKVEVFTGASKGIGAAISKHLAAAGASVVANYAYSAGVEYAYTTAHKTKSQFYQSSHHYANWI